jgi:hypothetical protein
MLFSKPLLSGTKLDIFKTKIKLWKPVWLIANRLFSFPYSIQKSEAGTYTHFSLLSQHSLTAITTILLLLNGNTMVQKKMGYCFIAYCGMAVNLYAAAFIIAVGTAFTQRTR